MQAVWWLWFGYFCFCRFAQRKFPPWIEPNVNAQFEWQFRHLRTSIYYYLDCKLQMINLTSELPVNACMVCMVDVCTWQSHCTTSIDWSFIYLCKLIACCSTGVFVRCTITSYLMPSRILRYCISQLLFQYVHRHEHNLPYIFFTFRLIISSDFFFDFCTIFFFCVRFFSSFFIRCWSCLF